MAAVQIIVTKVYNGFILEEVGGFTERRIASSDYDLRNELASFFRDLEQRAESIAQSVQSVSGGHLINPVDLDDEIPF